MKFLCDQCKAKYQIADEKVVGKTVRMKCRKCGHLIEVKAEITETSVATKLEDTAGSPQPGAATAAPRAPAAPRPAAAAPQKPAAPKSTLATSLASVRPTAASKPAVKPDANPLAAAFQKSVQSDDDALLALSPNTEWYVAINGVPVGPIRIGEIKRKASTGAITDDSLCWQEGMEEWRAVRATELATVVREAHASGRPSLLTPPPTDVRPTASPPVVAAKPAAPRAPQAKPAAPAQARSNVVPITSRLATAERLDLGEPEDDHTIVGDPFAPPIVAPAAEPIPPAADPFLTPPPSSPLAASAPVASAAPLAEAPPPVIAGVEQRKQPPWIAIAMVVLAGAFGVTAAIILLQRPPPTPNPVANVAPTTPTGTTPTATVATTDTAPAAATSAAPATSEKPIALNTNAGVRSGATATPASTGTGKVVDPNIAKLLGSSPGGPTDGTNGGGGSAGGGSLTSDMIQRVVMQHQTSVKRTCWERGGSTESDVSVKVHVSIAGNGSVSSTSSSGNDPAIAKCIETSVHSWVFPATGGTTEVDIPFHFLRQ